MAGEATPGPKMVKESDLLAAKAKYERKVAEVTQELETKTNQIRALESKLLEAESGGEVNVLDARRRLLEDTRKLQEHIGQVEADRQKLLDERHQLRAERLSAEFGVAVEELTQFSTEAEMKAYALEHKVAQMEKEKVTPPATPSRYEQGQAAAASANIWGMTDVDFRKHIDKLKAEAAAKGRG